MNCALPSKACKGEHSMFCLMSEERLQIMPTADSCRARAERSGAAPTVGFERDNLCSSLAPTIMSSQPRCISKVAYVPARLRSAAPVRHRCRSTSASSRILG
ncbi:hypothetical protein HBI65_124650 [Parastagonospora nodorum]|nr:hypothetical protein HBH52_012360 [Parastagonospora nodorum]KAH5318727.1 hypothetical protein HBI11_064090 [Parastagonospora nodorum]KAH6094535.1 hypothetical protein HBI65_124650 [Parastagonospora nodorum]